jgi:glycerol uptake facilitator-like aquaporin
MVDVKTENILPHVSDPKKYLAEFIGTMVLVLMGCGSAVIAGNYI